MKSPPKPTLPQIPPPPPEPVEDDDERMAEIARQRRELERARTGRGSLRIDADRTPGLGRAGLSGGLRIPE